MENDHFNVITDNEAIAVEIGLQNGDKVILATINCPNGNPSLRLFRTINTLLKQVIFLGDFNSKHKQFVKPNKSGQTLLNIAKRFETVLCKSNRYTREDPVHDTSDILDMAFITQGLSSRGIFVSVADDHMGSVIISPFKFHLTRHSNGTHHLPNHVTELTKQTMTYYTTH